MAETRSQPVSKTRTAVPKFSDQELYYLAEKFGTPYFLIDEATLRKNVTEIEQAYQDFKGPFRVAYSMKANFNPSVIKTFVSEASCSTSLRRTSSISCRGAEARRRTSSTPASQRAWPNTSRCSSWEFGRSWYPVTTASSTSWRPRPGQVHS